MTKKQRKAVKALYSTPAKVEAQKVCNQTMANLEKQRWDATPQCPDCGHREFSVEPHVAPELRYFWGKAGEADVSVVDNTMHDLDDVVCVNCGRGASWSDFGA